MKNTLVLLALFFTAICFGCGPRYSCPMPRGVVCKSITDIYYHRYKIPKMEEEEEKEKRKIPYETPCTQPPLLTSPQAVRRPPKIIRIWIAPWVDSAGDLHQPGYVYTEVIQPKWIFGEEIERITRPGISGPMPPPEGQRQKLKELDKKRKERERFSLPPYPPEEGKKEGVLK